MSSLLALAYQDSAPPLTSKDIYSGGGVVLAIWALSKVWSLLWERKDKVRVDTVAELNAMLKQQIENTVRSETVCNQYLTDNRDLRDKLATKEVKVGELTMERTYLVKQIEDKDKEITRLCSQLEGKVDGSHSNRG